MSPPMHADPSAHGDSGSKRSKFIKTTKTFLAMAAFAMIIFSTTRTNLSRFVNETPLSDNTVHNHDRSLATLSYDAENQLGGVIQKQEQTIQKLQESIEKLQDTIQHQEDSFGKDLKSLIQQLADLQNQEDSFEKDLKQLIQQVSELSVSANSKNIPTTTTTEAASPVKRQDIPLVLDAELAKDRDAWYGDISKHNPDGLNVTIELTSYRHDRLGSNVRRPLFLNAYAVCKGYKFCIQKGKEGVSKIFPFPTCPKNLREFSPLRVNLFKRGNNVTDETVDVSGTYIFGPGGSDDNMFGKAYKAIDTNCLFPEHFRQAWRDMILAAANDPSLNNITLAQENLYSTDMDPSRRESTTTIAVNIRRGDVNTYKRAIWDEIYVQLLQILRLAVERTGKTPEVHLFSENYGEVDARRKIPLNWTMYEGLVDQFHLAPKMGPQEMDVSLNMRDWRHFVNADILIVGGTFAEIPAYGRPLSPDPKTLKGLTLYPCPENDYCKPDGASQYIFGWTPKIEGRKDTTGMYKLGLRNIPESISWLQTIEAPESVV